MHAKCAAAARMIEGAMGASTHERATKRLIIVSIVVAVVVVLSSIAAISVVTLHLVGADIAEPATSVSDVTAAESQFRSDYPGWSLVDTAVTRYTESGHDIIEYALKARPPQKDYFISIGYQSVDGGRPRCLDEVLRPGAIYEERAEALYDLLEEIFVAEDKEMVWVVTLSDGNVIVKWERYTSKGMLRTRERDLELLYYSDYTESWLDAR